VRGFRREGAKSFRSGRGSCNQCEANAPSRPVGSLSENGAFERGGDVSPPCSSERSAIEASFVRLTTGWATLVGSEVQLPRYMKSPTTTSLRSRRFGPPPCPPIPGRRKGTRVRVSRRQLERFSSKNVVPVASAIPSIDCVMFEPAQCWPSREPRLPANWVFHRCVSRPLARSN